MNKKHHQSESGLALLMVTLLLFVMILVVTELVSTSQVQVLISENLTDSQKGFYLEEEAVILAEEILFLDINPPELLDPVEAGMTVDQAMKHRRQMRSDSYHDYWSSQPYEQQFGSSWLKSEIVDEDRKFNINYLVKPESSQPVPLYKGFFEKLLENLELKHTEATDIINNIVDYIDKDTKGKYEDGARNSPLPMIKELLDLKHVNMELFYGKDFPQGEVTTEEELEDLDYEFEEEELDENINDPEKNPFDKNKKSPPIEEWEDLEIKPGFKDLLTVYGDGKININTAPYPILLTLFGEEDVAKDIIIARKKMPFSNLDDLKEIAGTSEGLTKYKLMLKTTSSYFKVLMTLKHRNSTQYRFALVRRDQSGTSNILFRGATL